MSSTKNNSNAMEWTREKTLCLINEYRARRGLWDMTHDDYRKKEIKQKLLVEVSDSLGGNIPITEIEKKFHTLRTQYHREINRMKRKEPYNSKWFGFKNLQFLSSPKACRTNKARIRSEITEDGTVTTKMENTHDNSGGSPSSEEFLTLHPKTGTISFETVVATATSTPSNSRSQYEKLIEETTKDVEEDENMEMKPKVTYKEITIPIEQSSYMHVNQEIGDSSQQDDQQNQNSSDESIIPIPMHEDADGVIYTNGDDSDQADEQQQQQQTPQATHHVPRIIKIQKRDAYHNDFFENNQQHSAVPTKRIYFDNGKTTIVTTTHQPAKTNAGSSSANVSSTGVIQQRNTSNTVNIKGRLQPLKPLAQVHQTGQKPPPPRDAFTTYGEYVANEMRGIANREILISLKHKINTALFEAHMAELQK